MFLYIQMYLCIHMYTRGEQAQDYCGALYSQAVWAVSICSHVRVYTPTHTHILVIYTCIYVYILKKFCIFMYVNVVHKLNVIAVPFKHKQYERYECMCIYIYLCMYAYTYTTWNMCAYLYSNLSVCLHIQTWWVTSRVLRCPLRSSSGMYVYIYKCIYVFIYVCIHTYISIYMYSYVYVYTYIYINKYILCTFLHICKFKYICVVSKLKILAVSFAHKHF